MAAAEYYGANPGGQPQLLHPPAPKHVPLHQNPPYPLSDAPPPYSLHDHRPHSQPPPALRPSSSNLRPPSSDPRNGYAQSRPARSGVLKTHSSGPQRMYKASDFAGPSAPQPHHHQQPYQQVRFQEPHQQQAPQGYFSLAGSPAMAQVYGNDDGYSPRPARRPYRDDLSDRSRSSSRSRSRSRSRQHKTHHHHSRPQVQRKKSTGVHSFIGAGGGALIGDAIFPGLGTLGGAVLGGLGGHEYGKQRRAYSNPGRPKARSYSNDSAYYEDDYRRGRR